MRGGTGTTSTTTPSRRRGSWPNLPRPPAPPTRGVEVMAPSYGLLDMTVYGRQETWEDSPAGWPQRWEITGEQVRTNGRPTAQSSRLEAGRSDNLSPAGR